MFLRDYFQLQGALTTAYNAGVAYVSPATAAEKAYGHIIVTESANLIAGGSPDTIKIGPTTFTAVSGAPSTNLEFDASGTDVETAENLMSAINNHPSLVCLVVASMPDAENPYIDLEARHEGISGNSIALEYTSNYTHPGIMLSGTSLIGGSDATAAGEAYSVLASGLEQAAEEGKEIFTIVCQVNHEPTILRMETRYLDAFFAGVKTGLANEHILEYEFTLEIDLTDTSITKIKFNFTF